MTVENIQLLFSLHWGQAQELLASQKVLRLVVVRKWLITKTRLNLISFLRTSSIHQTVWKRTAIHLKCKSLVKMKMRNWRYQLVNHSLLPTAWIHLWNSSALHINNDSCYHLVLARHLRHHHRCSVCVASAASSNDAMNYPKYKPIEREAASFSHMHLTGQQPSQEETGDNETIRVESDEGRSGPTAFFLPPRPLQSSHLRPLSPSSDPPPVSLQTRTRGEDLGCNIFSSPYGDQCTSWYANAWHNILQIITACRWGNSTTVVEQSWNYLSLVSIQFSKHCELSPGLCFV